MKQPLYRAIMASLAITLPVAGTFLLNMLTSFVAVFYISKFGKTYLAASALILAVQVTTFVICMSALFSVSVCVGRAHGHGDKNKATSLLQQGCLLALLLSFLIIIILLCAPAILMRLNQPKPLVHIASLYFHTLVFGAIPLMFQTVFAQFIIGVSKQRIVTLSSAISLCCMAFLSYAFAFGKFGFPNLGVIGVALGVVCQFWIGCLFLLSQLSFREFFKAFKLFQPRPFEKFKALKQLFKIGWPISIQISTELIAIFTLTIMAGWLGKYALSARQITSQFLVFTIVPIIGISQAAGVLVSQNIGQQKFFEVSRIANINLILAFCFIIWFLLAFIFIPDTLASLYININDASNAHLLSLIKILFFIACFSQIFDSVRNISSGALRGLYDTRFTMFTSIIGLWIVALPLGYLLAFEFSMGIVGLSLAFTSGIVIAALIQWFRWRMLSKPQYLMNNYA